ncbi:glycosyltransferase [Paenibacillus sp. TRM 82003]|uniref:glycosyltransferase family 2 protein n=1 Tax=Kineococcus sp. TRM81007 TaxID=2925831 RepID=UPI001F5AD3FB|nr:glycosyltransferase [Kineococcus sp. TRM81007]MCI2238413.1 glycosyltransferase [Kineococcus sp. TRM81007]MCI3922074.1 glycosyltransferase [Paenibacillus sp. TRM 82003]
MAPGPRFTVLCATYNQAPYLREMLTSALRQTTDDHEVVIVDDGSTDATPAVLQDLLDELPQAVRSRVVVDRTPNRGQTAAFEHGFALSRGDYVCLLDSDDRFSPDKLRRIGEAVREHPEAGMLMHPLRVVDPAGEPVGVVRPQAAALSDGDLRQQMRTTARHVAPGTSGLVFRRDVLEQLFPAPTKGFPFAADAYLSFGAACLAPVRALAEPLADYRMQPQGQYFKRMLSPAGLRQQVEFQDAVAGHFGLLAASRRNSHYARNRYASAMLDGPWGRRVREFRALQAATLTDTHFTARQKAALTGFWSLTLLAGPASFPRLWGWFQRRQTGWDRVRRAAAAGSAPRPAAPPPGAPTGAPTGAPVAVPVGAAAEPQR